ncbi:hypothetical protein [Mycolicibacterium brisbanense]
MSDTSDLIWACDSCGKPVRDGTGYIHVSDFDRAEYRRNLAAWEATLPPRTGGPLDGLLSGRDLMNYPKPAKWQVHHGKCDPDPDAPDYWFAVERCRTPAAMLRWTAHLLGKGWFAEETDWSDFVYRTLRRSGVSTSC